MKDTYTNPKSPACFAGVQAILREARKTNLGIKRKKVQSFLDAQETYTLHKPKRRKFLHNRTVAWGIDSHWQADLCDMQSLSKHNGNVKYLLTVVDVLSKYAWAQPCNSKHPTSVRDAFEVILHESSRFPAYLYTDKGKEFIGKSFREFLNKKMIQHIVSQNPDVKASVAERYNRTLKTRIWKYLSENKTWRYIDVLQDIVNSINRSYHRSIGCRPVDVCMENENEVWNRLYGNNKAEKPISFKFNVGDCVRIVKEKHIFQKGYLPNFTQELFTISECVPRQPPVYRLEDLNGEPIEGIFYEQELVKYIKEDDVYELEKIIQKRTRNGRKEVLVKWMGYPHKFNQWIPESSVTMLKV